MKVKLTGKHEDLVKLLNILLGLGYTVRHNYKFEISNFREGKVKLMYLFYEDEPDDEVIAITPDEANTSFRKKLEGVPEIKVPNQANRFLDRLIDVNRNYDYIPEGWYFLSNMDNSNLITINRSNGTVQRTGGHKIATSKALAEAIVKPNEFMPDTPSEHCVLCPVTGKIRTYPEPPYTVKVSLWNNTIILNGLIIVFNGEPVKFINKSRFKNANE